MFSFPSDLQLYHSETLELMLQRWSKLERDFRMKNGRYDISKIPDIYDCIKYDTQHNASLGLEDTLELFRLSRALADIIIPQVYQSSSCGLHAHVCHAPMVHGLNSSPRRDVSGRKTKLSAGVRETAV